MKLYTYWKDGAEHIGVGCDEDSLYPVEAFGLSFAGMTDLIRRITMEEKKRLADPKNAVGAPLPLEGLKLCAPIPHPAQDVICLGINYHAHAAESARFNAKAFGGERPKAIYFSKRAADATGDGDPIPAYEGLVDGLDYEAELAVIVGKDAKKISEDAAREYVFGYTVLNDVSARNLQTGHKQWYFGKSLDGFTPFGPCILTADEVAFPPVLGISCTVNGETRQDSSTGLLIRGIAHILAELSQGMTLKAGTIIATGTPAGVGMGFDPPRFLKKGDVVTCTIEKIGSLTNRVV